MVCITQVSNVFGLMPPVDTILGYARQSNPNVISLIDGAQAAGLKLLNMGQIEALIFSGHKSLYGPYGVAGIAFGRGWRPEPLVYGGTGTQSESINMPTDGPSQFEAGSHNISAIAGLHAALGWLQETGRDTINGQVELLTHKLCSALAELPNVKLYLPGEGVDCTGIVSFNVEGVSPQAIETTLGAKGIAVRAGLHCAPWAHEFAGTNKLRGTIRIGLSYFNTSKHISELIKNLDIHHE
jgi:selenocysteine lyase/cysteine desulfurase